MKYVLAKRNNLNNSTMELNQEAIDKEYKNSILNHIKETSDWNECDAIAYSASQYFSAVLDCFQVDDKECMLLSIKYSEIIYKIIDKELDNDLLEKMKVLGEMTKKLKDLESALNSLQYIESDLYDNFTEISSYEPNVNDFADMNIDEHIEEYSMRNETIKEVFEEFFN